MEDKYILLCTFEDMFLINDKKQLKLQFNPTVSGFRYNVSESIQTTLGGQFPYIRRNGNNYYRTFSLSGLISSLIDEDSWYDSKFDKGETSNSIDDSSNLENTNNILPFFSKEKVTSET